MRDTENGDVASITRQKCETEVIYEAKTKFGSNESTNGKNGVEVKTSNLESVTF